MSISDLNRSVIAVDDDDVVAALTTPGDPKWIAAADADAVDIGMRNTN